MPQGMRQGEVWWGSLGSYPEPGASRWASYLFGLFLLTFVNRRYILWAMAIYTVDYRCMLWARGQCSSNVHVHVNLLGILLKCSKRGVRSEMPYRWLLCR